MAHTRASADDSGPASSGSTADLLRFIDASPSPYHVVATAITRLEASGFVGLDEADSWPDTAGRWYVRRGGAVTAWIQPGGGPTTPFRIVGAHTDSPNLRVKPNPDASSAGYRQLGVEIYGGALLNSWLDRDLGLSGRAVVRSGSGPQTHLFRLDEPVLRIPQLAIHLDREISVTGLKLNPQKHMTPVWGLGSVEKDDFRSVIAALVGVETELLLAWDAMTHDLTPSAIVGLDASMIAAPRLDNQLSCWAAITALCQADPEAVVPVVCLFDHEEVGSVSQTGARSSMLTSILERIVIGAGGDGDALHRSLATSWCVSADGAHATHPNYADRHDPNHTVALNGGPAVKINANERYATSAPTHGRFIDACVAAGVAHQSFVSRNDAPCGSTIGPVTSARLGIATVDAGIAQLAMHSARETAGALDPPMFVSVLQQVFAR